MNTYEISYKTSYGTINQIKIEASTIREACDEIRKNPTCKEVISYKQLNIVPTQLTFNTNNNGNN